MPHTLAIMTMPSPPPAPEARCILCDQPMIDHVALRYWWAQFWRHRLIPIAGFVLGHLPLKLLGDPPDW